MFTGELSQKQIEFVLNSHHRWNFRGGATRCGKTYLDQHYTIAKNIRERAGLDGLNVLIGVTRGTLERNILKPMRDAYGEGLVGRITNDNTVKLFGDTAYCFGAEKKSAVSKIRGSSVKYCYGDEVADWAQGVFDIIKSRLDQPYARFDGTYNPQGKGHWLYAFLQKQGIDLFNQQYSIFDNPFIDPQVVKELCAEYSGSVLYNRYILGEWCNAEGSVYELYANNPDGFDISSLPPIQTLSMGVDFGGNKSATAFVLGGFTVGFQDLVIIKSRKLGNGIYSPKELETAFVEFIREAQNLIKKPITCYCDSAEQTLIKGLKIAAQRNALPVMVKNALKGEITERIRLLNRLMGGGRFKVWRTSTNNAQVRDALASAMYNDKKFEDERLDDGSSDIDTVDAVEYLTEPYARYLFND